MFPNLAFKLSTYFRVIMSYWYKMLGAAPVDSFSQVQQQSWNPSFIIPVRNTPDQS